MQQQSVQQRFDAAMKFNSENKSAQALSAFETLEADLLKLAKPKLLSLALVRAYKASALAKLGRDDAAKESLKLAFDSGLLNNIAAASARQDARLLFANILRREFDDAGAAAQYKELAADESDTAVKAGYLALAAQMLTVLDPQRALSQIGEAVALVEPMPQKDKVLLADIYRIRGRGFLNAGQIVEARRDFKKAISLSGGLDTRITYAEFATRSDAAIAALQAKDKNDARELLAYTGAGRTKVKFPVGIEMALPECGGIDGLLPTDMAIVEFSIADNGKVLGARPVFGSRPGQMAYVFARAINDWAWAPERIVGLEKFFRSTMRVEVRCTRVANRPSVSSDLDRKTMEWFAQNGASREEFAAVLTGKPGLDPLKAKLDDANVRAKKPLAAALNLAIARDDGMSRDESLVYLTAAIALMRDSGAPPSAWLGLAIGARINWSASFFGSLSAFKSAREIERLTEDPLLARDPEISATIHIVAAEFYARARKPDLERAALNAVVNDSVLAANHPLKISALLTLANLSAVAGDVAGAKAAYEKTGLDARQCAALDTPPVMIKSNVSSLDFPIEAMQWGFEGWSRQEFDITATGQTENIRTIIAFPPAVFAEASSNMAKAFKYRATFRPEGGLGCGGQNRTIIFNLPDRAF
jgi:tetratricopeptide (TPR) repeat protein